MDNEHKSKLDQEIDFIEVVEIIWSKRFFIFNVSSIFLAFGIITALFSKTEYVASARLMPESQKGISPDLGGLGGLAGLAGINLNMSENGSLIPELYPEIVKSSLFIHELINTPIYFENIDKTISSFSYFKDIEQPSLLGLTLEYTIGLPGKLKKAFSSPSEGVVSKYDLIRFSKEEWDIMREYSKRLSVSVDPKTGVITVETELPDAVAAAKTATLVVSGLTEKIIKYKVEKAEINLQFIKERFQEAKEEYEVNQSRLAVFTDRNRNISNGIIQTEYERLQNEMNIAFEVYKGLATQLEQAKIQVKEETPVFTILEPVKIPVEKSKPKRSLIALTFLFLGVLASLAFVLAKSAIEKLKQRRRN
jgi:uncharacterized protein involved in exopolysaccharide biosynthesis